MDPEDTCVLFPWRRTNPDIITTCQKSMLCHSIVFLCQWQLRTTPQDTCWLRQPFNRINDHMCFPWESSNHQGLGWIKMSFCSCSFFWALRSTVHCHISLVIYPWRAACYNRAMQQVRMQPIFSDVMFSYYMTATFSCSENSSSVNEKHETDSIRWTWHRHMCWKITKTVDDAWQYDHNWHCCFPIGLNNRCLLCIIHL